MRVARELVDLASGLRMPTWLESTTSSHSSSIGNIARQCSPNSLTLFVSSPTRSPRSFSSRILCTTIQCTPGARRAPEPAVRVHVDRLCRAPRAPSRRCDRSRSRRRSGPSRAGASRARRSTSPAALARRRDRSAIAPRRPRGPRRRCSASRRTAAASSEPFAVALGFLERADADEQRARDDAAEVEDDGADHADIRCTLPCASNTMREHRDHDPVPAEDREAVPVEVADQPPDREDRRRRTRRRTR